MIFMVLPDHPNTQVANQQERTNSILLLLYHLESQFHLDLIFLNHLNVLIHLQAIKRIILELQWNLAFILLKPLNLLSKRIQYMEIGHRPKSNNRLGLNKISYKRYLGKDTRNNQILSHRNLQILDLKIKIFETTQKGTASTGTLGN